MTSKEEGQEGQVPDFGLGDAAGGEDHQAVAADPQLCGQGFFWCGGPAVSSLFPSFTC